MSDALALALINFVQVVFLAYLTYRTHVIDTHVKNGNGHG